jgi:hypothetical protein
MNNDSPDVGTSDDDDDDDVSRRHPAGLLFWGVRTFESRIPMLSSSDPLGMSTAQRKFVSHYYSVGGNGGVVVVGGGITHSEGNLGYEEAEEDNDGMPIFYLFSIAARY